jgi:RNase P subunit RPR2
MMAPPQDDSSDLTEEEIGRALATGSPADMAQKLSGQVCRVCGESLFTVRQQKRRRSPHIYSRVTLTCPNNHWITQLYQVTWSRGVR